MKKTIHIFLPLIFLALSVIPLSCQDNDGSIYRPPVSADGCENNGDLNRDGIGSNIADAVLFTNYFVYGDAVFGPYVDDATAASDVNCDGRTLTVADFVFMIKKITGDEVSLYSLDRVVVEYRVENGILYVDGDIGAIYVEYDSDADITLLAEGMEMKYSDGKVFVYSLDGNSFSGQVLGADADIVDIEMATADADFVTAINSRRSFRLLQNYPNPFYGSTVIAFTLAYEAGFNLTIKDVYGQPVREYYGTAGPGEYTVQWDAAGCESGIYFYTLKIGDFSTTRKMLLLNH